MHLTGGTMGFVPGPLRFLAPALRFLPRSLRLFAVSLSLLAHSLDLLARTFARFFAGLGSLTLRLPDGLSNGWIEVPIELEVLHFLVESLHLVVEVIHVEVEAEITLVLANFLLPELHRDFLLCVLSQDSKGHVCPFGLATYELRELIGIHENLVVKHLENVIRL